MKLTNAIIIMQQLEYCFFCVHQSIVLWPLVKHNTGDFNPGKRTLYYIIRRNLEYSDVPVILVIKTGQWVLALNWPCVTSSHYGEMAKYQQILQVTNFLSHTWCILKDIYITFFFISFTKLLIIWKIDLKTLNYLYMKTH